MPYCARCGAPVGNADAFCVACGAPTKHHRALAPPGGPADRSLGGRGDASAAPSTPLDASGSAAAISASAARQRSLLLRGRFVAVLLTVAASVSVATAVSTAVHLGDLLPLPDGTVVTDEMVESYDRRQQAIDALDLLVLVGTGVAWLVWQHGAHSNLRLFGASGLKFTPGWGVGWWFIPVANLWMPYRAVRELWTVSRPHPDGRRRTSAPIVGWWWAVWLVSTLLPGVGPTIMFDAFEVGPYVIGGMVLIAGELITIIGASLAALVVVDVVRGQRELHETFAGVLQTST